MRRYFASNPITAVVNKNLLEQSQQGFIQENVHVCFSQHKPCCHKIRHSNEIAEHKDSCCLQYICYYEHSKVSIVSSEDRCPLLKFTAMIFLIYV